MLEVNYENIPSHLVGINQWFVWTRMPRGDGKSAKLPKNPRYLIAVVGYNKKEHQRNIDEVINIYEKHHKQFHLGGIGLGITPDIGVVGVDLDHCIKDGVIEYWAEKIITPFSGRTYIEISQSGFGIHIVFLGKLPPEEMKNRAHDGHEIEVYNDHFLTFTGNKIPNSAADLSNCQDLLDGLLELYCEKIEGGTKPQKTPWSGVRNGKSLADAYGLRVENIGMPTNPTRKPKGYQGGHPVHGSTTGWNYEINTDDNTWYCHSKGHKSGGDALILFAVKEGIIKCENAGPGCLNGKWEEVFAALERCGYKNSESIELEAMAEGLIKGKLDAKDVKVSPLTLSRIRRRMILKSLGVK